MFYGWQWVSYKSPYTMTPWITPLFILQMLKLQIHRGSVTCLRSVLHQNWFDSITPLLSIPRTQQSPLRWPQIFGIKSFHMPHLVCYKTVTYTNEDILSLISRPRWYCRYMHLGPTCQNLPSEDTVIDYLLSLIINEQLIEYVTSM